MKCAGLNIISHCRNVATGMLFQCMKPNLVGITFNSSVKFYCISCFKIPVCRLTWLTALFTDEDELQTGSTAFTLFRLIGVMISSSGGECQRYDELWHGFGLWSSTPAHLLWLINAVRAFAHQFIALASLMQLRGTNWYPAWKWDGHE